jgi:hypothetical protein
MYQTIYQLQNYMDHEKRKGKSFADIKILMIQHPIKEINP